MAGDFGIGIERYRDILGRDVLDFVAKHLRENWIESGGERIHLDVFARDAGGPTIVFSHGLAGYGRLLAPYAYRLYQLGYNVILPDLAGYGHNRGLRGHWTWDALVENLTDACCYARQSFEGDVFLAGASMGGPLAYRALCKGAPARAIACYCLYDFGDEELARKSSPFGSLLPLMKPLVGRLSRVLPRVRIPISRVLHYDKLSGDPAFNELLRTDPLAGNSLSLRAISEMLNAALPIEFEEFDLAPILILQPGADEMTPPRFSREAYGRLHTSRKRYVEVEGRGHWILDEEGIGIVCAEMDRWFVAARNAE